MSQSRIEAFKGLLAEQPDEAMIWYGLANEYIKLEQWPDATEALQNVIRCNADYTAAYQMLGSALSSQGKTDEARRVWAEGLEVAARTGAWNARAHMERLLAQTNSQPANDSSSDSPDASASPSSSEFCQ
jgi:predicted Zn-dependent protease